MKRQRVLYEKNGWLQIFAETQILHNSLITHLTPMTLLVLVRVHPSIRNALNGKLYSIIYAKILAYLDTNIEKDVLNRFLRQNYVLTGSALLAALTYAPWKSNDIDLCHTGDDSAPDIFPIVQKRYDPEDLPFRKQHNVSYPHSVTLLSVTTYKNVQCGESYIQLLRVTNPATYIQSFDYGFCKNQLSADKLVIYNPVSVIESRTTISLAHYLNNPIYNPEFMMHTFLPTRYDRMCKYVLRGYEIIISNPYWSLVDIRIHMKRIMKKCPKTMLSTAASYWHMFWFDRIDKEGHVVLNRPPTWNHGEIPSKIKQNT